MSSAAVRAAFKTRFSAAYPSMSLIDIENVQPTLPTDTNGFVTACVGLLFFATEAALAVGSPDNRQWRETGTINALVFYPADQGVDGAVEIADTIRNLFAGVDLPVASPGVKLSLLDATPLTQYLSRPGAPTGVYATGAVAIAYQYDFIR